MKKKITWFLLSILFAGFIYLCFSFGTWQLNPKYWQHDIRVLFSLCMFFAISLSNIIPHID